RHFDNNLSGKLLVSAGLGGMGGAQPLAATLAGATFLGADVDPDRIKKRMETRYIDRMTTSYEEARERDKAAMKAGKALSVCVGSYAGGMLERLLEDGIVPDILTDQPSAQDPVCGYVPNGLSLTEAKALRESDVQQYKTLSLKSRARHVHLMLEMQKKGSIVFDYGNNLRAFALEGGEKDAFNFPGFVQIGRAHV